MSGATNKAVFLSYASQDAEAVRRIAEALRAVGVEVWFDQNELVGGDAWDAKIRGQIASCALFVPVISAATQARLEGYFRIEWKLAAQRTHAMADEKAFLLPVVIDGTRDAEAKVPGEFKAVQWTRLPGGETPEKFCARVKHLLGEDGIDVGPVADRAPGQRPGLQPSRATKRSWFVPAVIAAAVLAIAAVVILRPRTGSEARPPAPADARQVPFSPARQLAEKANAMSLQKYNSTADDFAAAEGLLKEALALDQNDAEIWAIASLFNTAIRTRGFDDAPARREAARSQAERALKLDPQSIEGLFALGRWQRDNDSDRTVAEKTFLAVLARAPEHEGAIGNLGTMYGRQDRVEEALAMFERAARTPSTLALARYSQYLVYFNHGRMEEAERAVRASIAAESSANSVCGLAMVLLTAKGDAAAAGRALADVPAANRNEHRAVWMTAFAHLAAREPEAALTALRRLSADFVQDNWFIGPTAYWTGRAHAQAGRAEAARIAFESGVAVMDAKLKATPSDFALHVARGELLAWLGRTDEALRAARTATELMNPREATLWFVSPARIYAALGRADEALPLLEKLSARDSRAVQWPLTPALLRIDPLWDKLRGDARFQALIVEAKPVEKQSAITPTAPKIADKSVAVLAFANLSDDKGNEYFSDGISEELLNVLAKVPGLKVSARTSAFHFKGKDTPIPEIAQQLGVAYVVEGSVRKQGDKVRITAQLIKAADGFHVWSDTFTRDLKDIFAVQDEIAGLIAKNLSLKLGASSSGAKAAINPEAFELYVQARQAWNLRTTEGFDRAEELLNRALALEPDFARAHAALSDVWGTRGSEIGQFGRRESPLMRRIIAAAERAVALDPNSGEAHASLGNAYLNSWKLAEATRTLRHAVALNPNYATGRQMLGRALLAQGYFAEAAAEMARATELDPLSHRIIDNYAIALFAMGRPTEALAATERALALWPDSVQAGRWRARCLSKLGRHEEAVAQARRVKEDDVPTSVYLVEVFVAAGLKSEAEEILAKLDRNFAGRRFVGLLELGRYEEALAAMNPAEMNPQSFYQTNLDPVRDDPRFKQVLATLGLTDTDARVRAWHQAHPPEKPAAKK
ncbi:MAG: tetratricopeptide repeat protein [Opitutaceae bacterium]|nr:tetratricopeptide repeat protein [Opitutaceae bacterium]